jgi:hypothetical protein
MENTYFHIVKSQNPKEEVAVKEHQQRLNNYLKYKFSGTDNEISSVTKFDYSPRPYIVKVCSQSSSTCMKNHDFVITTVLCCEDEPKGEKEEME